MRAAVLRQARKMRDRAPAPVRNYCEDKADAIAVLVWLLGLTVICEAADIARRRREAQEAERARLGEWLG